MNRQFTDYLSNVWHWWLDELQSLTEVFINRASTVITVANINDSGEIAITNRQNLSRGKIKIQLPERKIMYREIMLPGVAVREINQILEYEFSKYFPVPVADVVYGMELSPLNKNTTKIHVWAVNKKYLENILSEIEEKYTVTLNSYIVANTYGKELMRLRNNNRKRPHRGTVSKARLKIVYHYVIPALILACLIAPVVKLKLQIEENRKNVAELEKTAGDLLKIKGAMLQVESRLATVIQEKNSTLQFVELWSILSDVLAGNAKVNNVSYKDGKVRIVGNAVSVEKIIKKLRIVKVFEDIAIDAPVRNLRVKDQETMNISFKVKNEN